MKVTSNILEPYHINANNFSETTYRKGTLYVPAGTKELYARFDGWRNFLNIVEMSDGSELTLTIQDAQSGKTKLLVKAGENYTLQFVPENGWKIHRVAYDNKDVTSQLDDDNRFTTPYITENAQLSIAYEKTTTNAKWSNTENLKVRCNSSGVVVSGISVGLPILVYNTDGQLVGSASSTLGATLVETTLNSGDVAIVKVGDKAVKLVME